MATHSQAENRSANNVFSSENRERMKIFAETPRLILRELLPEDDKGMFELDKDPLVHQYLGNKPIQDIAQARENIRLIRGQYADYGIGRWAMIEKNSNDFIGWAGLKFMDLRNGYKNYYDIGYRLIPRFWGKGFATEAAVASRDYAFREMNLAVIYGCTHIENLTSKHILQKIGLQFIETFTSDNLVCNWLELKKKRWETM